MLRLKKAWEKIQSGVEKIHQRCYKFNRKTILLNPNPEAPKPFKTE